MLLLDTHALVWLSEGCDKIGAEAVQLIDKSLKKNELYVSSVSFWEVAMLSEKGRIELFLSIDAWRRELINNGLQEIPLSGEIAIKSALLKNFHGDPADRMIVATAVNSGMILCTADKKILEWQYSLHRINAKH